MMGTITIADLSQLGMAVRKDGLTVSEWKAAVKRFADTHGISDIEAIELANIADDHFPLSLIQGGL